MSIVIISSVTVESGLYEASVNLTHVEDSAGLDVEVVRRRPPIISPNRGEIVVESTLYERITVKGNHQRTGKHRQNSLLVLTTRSRELMAISGISSGVYSLAVHLDGLQEEFEVQFDVMANMIWVTPEEDELTHIPSPQYQLFSMDVFKSTSTYSIVPQLESPLYRPRCEGMHYVSFF